MSIEHPPATPPQRPRPKYRFQNDELGPISKFLDHGNDFLAICRECEIADPTRFIEKEGYVNWWKVSEALKQGEFKTQARHFIELLFKGYPHEEEVVAHIIKMYKTPFGFGVTEDIWEDTAQEITLLMQQHLDALKISWTETKKEKDAIEKIQIKFKNEWTQRVPYKVTDAKPTVVIAENRARHAAESAARDAFFGAGNAPQKISSGLSYGQLWNWAADVSRSIPWIMGQDKPQLIGKQNPYPPLFAIGQKRGMYLSPHKDENGNIVALVLLPKKPPTSL